MSVILGLEVLRRMRIIKDNISRDELQQMAKGMFGNLVKAVVDVDKEIMVVEG